MGSSNQPPGEITELLRRWGSGDLQALEELAELAYSELRAIAGGYLRRELPGHTLQATGLVNELYLRLARQRSVQFSSRRHFYVFAALIMRRILRDYARQNAAERRSARVRIPLHPDLAWVDAGGEEMVTLDSALDELQAIDERKVRAIELHYFLGCTREEAAELLGVALATVDRDLQFARSWLYRRLCPQPSGS